MDVMPLLLIFVVASVSSIHAHDEHFHLTILHTSDFTGAFEQFDIEGEECSEEESAKGRGFFSPKNLTQLLY